MMRYTNNSTPTTQGEWTKFGILAIILVGTVLVIALIRPLVFDKIVPALLHNFLNPLPTLVVPTPNIFPTATPFTEIQPTLTMPATEATPTLPLLPSPTTPMRVHIVQPGDVLVNIAQQYGVTVEAIMTLNNLTNPHQLQIGQQLLIP